MVYSYATQAVPASNNNNNNKKKNKKKFTAIWQRDFVELILFAFNI